MKKFIIYLLPIFFINSSIVYSEEVITINNDTLYNKNNLKKKLNKAIKDNDRDLGVFYSEKLLKISPNYVKKKEIYNTLNEKQKIRNNYSKIYFNESSNTSYRSFEDALKNPTKVEYLYINSNQNSDSISLPNDLYRLSKLKSLIIHMKKIKNIERIGNLKNLELLSLNFNDIKEIPKEIKNLTKLKRLLIFNNLITEIPNEILNLKNLQDIVLYNNNIQKIPKEIKNLTKIKKLDFSCNLITEIPKEIGYLENLEELDISYQKSKLNNIIYFSQGKKMDLPYEITKLKNLKYLNLSNSKIETLTDNFGLIPLKSLKIRLDNENIGQVEKSLEQISKITSLETLSITLSGNERIPISFSNLSSLKELEVSSFSNKKSSNIIDLVKLVSSNNNLKKLLINSTDIKTLPDEIIPMLSKLELLDLSFNNIEKIPDSISKLESLETLSLSFNKIINIPDEIGNLLNLKELNLIGNKITNVPDSISELENLEILSLTSNKITNIPSSISKLKNLKSLYLSSNKIEKIPDEIENLSKLKHLSLSNNKLSDSTKNHIKSTLKTLSLNL